MRTQSLLHICLSVFLITLSCTHQDSENWKYEKVILSGRVLHFEKHQKHKTIEFIFRDVLKEQNEVASIGEDGTFSAEVNVAYPQDFYIKYGLLTTLFCSPGDSLYIEIDGDIWTDRSNKKPNGQYFILVKGGIAVEVNKDLRNFYDEIPNEKYIYQNANNAIKEKSPEEYKVYIENREKEYRIFLKDFNEKQNTGELFRKWANANMKYESWNDLLYYSNMGPNYKKISRDSMSIPDNYYSFLDIALQKFDKIIPMNAVSFSDQYSHYITNKLPKDTLEKARKLFNEGNTLETTRMQFHQLTTIHDGAVKDAVLARFFYNLLSQKLCTEFENLYNPELISCKFYNREIDKEYQRVKNLIDNPELLKNTSIGSIEKEIVGDLMDTITSRYNGKVIYLDFWAPWCSPCMDEIPYSSKLQEFYKTQDVIFLFLANRCTEESWKATIAEKKMTGEHLLLTGDQYTVLTNKFGIHGIPHYVLIDKNGKVVFKNAARPSTDIKIKEEIDNLLN